MTKQGAHARIIARRACKQWTALHELPLHTAHLDTASYTLGPEEAFAGRVGASLGRTCDSPSTVRWFCQGPEMGHMTNTAVTGRLRARPTSARTHTLRADCVDQTRVPHEHSAYLMSRRVRYAGGTRKLTCTLDGSEYNCLTTSANTAVTPPGQRYCTFRHLRCSALVTTP